MTVGNPVGSSDDQKVMGCDSWRDAISADLDGELDDDERPGLEAHLAACAACRTWCDDVAALDRTVRLRRAEVVPDLTDAILAGATTRARPRWRAPAVVATAAALVAVALLSWPSPGPGAPPDIRAELAVATAAPASGASAVYLSLTNEGGDDRLVGVVTAGAAGSLHTVEVDDGMVVMAEHDGWEVPAGTDVTFPPGGAHVMLEALDEGLDPGEEVALELRFERSEPVLVRAEVVAPDEVVDRTAALLPVTED